MNENQLRDTKNQPRSSSTPTLPVPTASTSTVITTNIPNTNSSSSHLINFLTSMTKTTLEIYDPKYENVQPHEWARICQEKCDKEISLIEGIKNPEKVCPRTKWDFSCSRLADKYDMAFLWYRMFVSIADWANNIPEFRMLPEQDQAQLLRVNFTTLSIMVYADCPTPSDPRFIPVGNGSYIGNNQLGYSMIDLFTFYF